MTRMTTEDLDALIAEHRELGIGSEWCAGCDYKNHFQVWPCEVYLLATEVRGARAVIELAQDLAEYVIERKSSPFAITARALKVLGAMAHYEEGRP